MPESPDTFDPSDYQPIVFGSGATKLADSQVAPLVAIARGARSYRRDTLRTLLEQARQAPTGAGATKARKLLAPTDSDLLVLPWMSVSTTFEGDAQPSMATYFQVRPSHPLVDDTTGRTAKYDGFGGATAVLDVHPATPTGWFKESRKWIITEGVVKGDAALTAQLLAAGITHDELRLADDGRDDPDKFAHAEALRLRGLMGRIKASKSVPIVSMLGVSTWHQNPEWNAISVRDRNVLVAFDGDLRTNFHVHQQGLALFEFIATRGGHPHLIDLGSSVVQVAQDRSGWSAEHTDADGNVAKVGLDDYLAHPVGSWSDMLGLATATLPNAPKAEVGDIARVDDHRVSIDGTKIERCVAVDGRTGKRTWEAVDQIGGRLVRIVSTRPPGEQEVLRGVHMPTLDETATLRAELEVSWVDEHGIKQTALVKGPTAMLDVAPERWSTMRAEVYIPPELSMSSAWPPKSREFIRAIKASSDPELTIEWDAMGWVPTRVGAPVYLIGTQALGATADDENSIACGLTESTLRGASGFGVDDRYRDIMESGGLQEYKAYVRDVVERTVELFLGDRSWHDETYRVLVFAGLMRPTMPAPWRGAFFFYGPPGNGKTFTAVGALTGWQREPGTWVVGRMPGSAQDSQYSQEWLIGRMPVWVTDDNAASASESQAAGADTRLDGLIRQLSAGSTRRAYGGDGKLRNDPAPRAVMFFTAENELATASAGQRLIMLRVKPNALPKGSPMDHEISGTAEATGIPAELTACLIRYWHQDHRTIATTINGVTVPGGEPARTWDAKIAVAASRQKRLSKFISTVLQEQHDRGPSDAVRPAELISSLAVVYDYLQELYVWAGGDLADLPLVSTSRIVDTLVEYAVDRIIESKSSSVASRFLEGVADTLRSNRAYVGGVVPGQPPYSDAKDGWKNELLGWRLDGDRWMPNGPRIGTCGKIKGVARIVFDHAVAFRAAKDLARGAVLPGQSAATTWQAATQDMLVNASRQSDFYNGGTSVRVRGPWMPFAQFAALGSTGQGDPDPEAESEQVDDRELYPDVADAAAPFQ